MRASVHIWRRRKYYFGLVFDADQEGAHGLAAERVLAALRDYCMARSATVGDTPEATYRMIGRRDVWLFIQANLNFDETQYRDFLETHDEYFGE